MYKNQLQELAQRSCFGLPSYSCIREGPDHAPRFKATVNFNGETFESPAFFSTLRHAEHAAAEVALNMLAMKGPSRALTARVLDETGVYKNLLQETAHRAGLNLPTYNTVRSGPGHVPSFSCTVELGGMTFVGQPSRTKKQAQKNAAMSAWSSLRKMTMDCASSSSSSSTPSLESKASEEQEQAIVARFLTNLQPPKPKTKNKSTGHVQRGKNLYPIQNWTYSSFSPEMFVYNLLEEQKILQQQQQMTMMMLPYPRVFPVLHYRPESFQYFPVAPRISIGASRPYFSNQSASDPSCSRSTVTIQEILDEKTDEMVGQPSVESRVVGPTPVSGSRPETLHPQTYAPVRMRSTGESCDRSLPQTVRVVGPTPVSGSSPETRNPQTYAPVRMRTWGGSDPSFPRSVRVVGPAPVSSSRPETRHPQTYAPIRMRSFLAPPVRIRSVVPVCSAPPSMIPRQGRLEKKVNEVDEACSELGDLQL